MNAKKILIIEDDVELARFLAWQLEQNAYQVSIAHSGQEGLDLLRSQNPDLILLDLMLPGMDGWEVLRTIRSTGETPVIIISALGTESDIVRGLESGADDYLTKPFGPRQLIARVQAVLRRYESTASRGVYDNGRLYVNLITQEVRVDGRPVELTPTEFRLLSTLARFAGRPLTHDFLLREVWGEEHIQDRGYLKLYIWYLRQKIEPDPNHPLFIRTERGIGYRLVGPGELGVHE
ncbi:response regulator transcription factor [Thermoflexus sp.]|uniref:response regulator transcription factor n=1 Tax=Thermoflexus sp. TaxID=1969742 RepID=UPI002ADD7D13|nr:response regulator transcription factor [Thermoflexus sp.]